LRSALLKAFDLPNTPDKDLAKPLLQALLDRLSGKITQRDLVQINFIWLYENCFSKNLMDPKQQPQKSINLIKYMSLTKEDKALMNGEAKIKLDQELEKWTDKCYSTLEENKNTLHTLGQMKKYYAWCEDWDKYNKIKRRIRLYETSHLQRESTPRFKKGSGSYSQRSQEYPRS